MSALCSNSSPIPIDQGSRQENEGLAFYIVQTADHSPGNPDGSGNFDHASGKTMRDEASTAGSAIKSEDFTVDPAEPFIDSKNRHHVVNSGVSFSIGLLPIEAQDLPTLAVERVVLRMISSGGS